MFKAKAITAIVVSGIFGLAACGGGSSDKDDSTVTTVRQKNAALSFTTLPATTMPKTVTTPMPNIGGAKPPTSTAPKATTTTQVKTVTTPLPVLGGGRPRPSISSTPPPTK
jgi:hypothetical protein